MVLLATVRAAGLDHTADVPFIIGEVGELDGPGALCCLLMHWRAKRESSEQKAVSVV